MFKKIREELDKGFFIPMPLLKNFLGAVGPLTFVIGKNPKAFIENIPSWKMRIKNLKPPWAHMEDERQYDSRRLLSKEDYEDLPPVRNEKYLRPTRLCESDAPEIRAMAKKLWEGKESEMEFVKAAYYFVKNEKKLVFKTMGGAIQAFRTKGGVCLEQLALLAAIARAGGIPARYRLYALAPTQPMYDVMVKDNPILKQTYEMLGFLDAIHGEAELLVNGKWIALDPTFSDELEAGMGLPVTDFGEEPMWRVRIPESDIRFEGFPILFRHFLIPVAAILRKAVDSINAKLDELREQGREILEDVGREEYNKKVKKSFKITVPSVSEVKAFRNAQLSVKEVGSP
ncbi:hypothetical protein B6U81_04890 [Thermoplasmatales archaeon ex4484_30]|nr:MAG: hypothetical protein B6U81_04890 [Thermoplasmatales archaeon ex4484_30]